MDPNYHTTSKVLSAEDFLTPDTQKSPGKHNSQKSPGKQNSQKSISSETQQPEISSETQQPEILLEPRSTAGPWKMSSDICSLLEAAGVTYEVI